MLDALDELGLADTTVVILTADHGEAFGEHGRAGHGKSLHEQVVRVPLLVHVPDLAPRRVAETVRLIDVMPTVLALFDVASPPAAGASLVPALRGEAIEPRPALGELRQGPDKTAESLTLGRWKLVLDHSRQRALLFDRDVDRGERTDVAGEHTERVEEMTRRLRALVAAAEERAAQFDVGTDVEISDEERAMFEKLGYTNGE